MANMTETEHNQSTGALLCTNIMGLNHYIFLTAFIIFLSITASLGNVLILVALHKESSLYPPSKLMFRCLAITDLGVGLISQPVYAAQLMSEMKNLRQICNFFVIMTRSTSVVLSGVSLLTAAAISVDRLLALSLCLRYRQVVTLRRVGAILSWVWFVCLVISLMDRYYPYIIMSTVVPPVIVLCIITSVCCYTKIFFAIRRHQVHMQDHVYQGQSSRVRGEISVNIARYRKTVSAALWIQLTLVACYLPQALVRAFASLCSMNGVSFIVAIRYAATLVYINSSLNPFLYIWKIREVRKEVKDLILKTKFCTS